VIEDLDGALSESTRRRHFAVLSAATAAVSLVLFVVLVAPPTHFGEAPQAAPSASARASFLMTARSSPLTNLPLDLTRPSVCPNGSLLTPPYLLVVEAETGRILAGVFDGNSFPHLVTLQEDAGTGKVTVTCATETGEVVTGDMFDTTQTWEFDVR
jgi:hypothetical protein